MKVTLSPGFLLLAAWLFYRDSSIFLLTSFACLCHELGHLAALRLLRVPVRGVRLTAVGAEIHISGGLSYRAELAAALAGPAVNLALAAGVRDPRFAGINLLLGLFNLMPLGRMDGGRAAACLLALGLGEPGERLTAALSRWISVLMVAAGGWLFWRWHNPALLLVGGWAAVRRE